MIFLLACGIRYVGHFGKNTSRGFVEKNLRKKQKGFLLFVQSRVVSTYVVEDVGHFGKDSG